MSRRVVRSGLLAVFTLLFLNQSVAQTFSAAPVRLKPLVFEAGGKAAQPNVAALPREGFVVTWLQKKAGVEELWFAEFTANGIERQRGLIARGANWFANWADFPALVVLDNGDWVTFWLEQSAGLPYAYDIKLTRSQDRGRHWSKPIVPHTDGTLTQHGFVSLLPDGADRVLVTWLDGRRAAESATLGGGHDHDEEAAPMTLRTVVLDRAGHRQGEHLLDDSTCSCCQTDAVRWVGRSLVAYRDRSGDEIRDIAVTARGVDGLWSKPRILHPDNWRIEGCPVNGPALAVNRNHLLAIWPTLRDDQMIVRYQVREWDQPAVTRVLDTGERVQGRVDAIAWREGFLVSWLGGQQSDAGPRIGLVDKAGQLTAAMPIATTDAARSSGFLRMASVGDRALLAFTAPTREGGSSVRLVLLSP